MTSNLSMRRAALISRLPKARLRDAIRSNKLVGTRAGASGAWHIDERDLPLRPRKCGDRRASFYFNKSVELARRSAPKQLSRSPCFTSPID
jgi:hypothetical protein